MSGKTIDLVVSALVCARPNPVFYQLGEVVDASEEAAARWDQWRLCVNEIEQKMAANFPWFNRAQFLKSVGYDP